MSQPFSVHITHVCEEKPGLREPPASHNLPVRTRPKGALHGIESRGRLIVNISYHQMKVIYCHQEEGQ
jgi:hypothetical protein